MPLPCLLRVSTASPTWALPEEANTQDGNYPTKSETNSAVRVDINKRTILSLRLEVITKTKIIRRTVNSEPLGVLQTNDTGSNSSACDN